MDDPSNIPGHQIANLIERTAQLAELIAQSLRKIFFSAEF